MKYIFAIVFVVLTVASVFIYASYPDVRTEVPVLYWVTDNNPARQQQIATYHQWLINNGHGELVTVSTLDEARDLQRRELTLPLIHAMHATTPDALKVWNVEGEPLPLTETDLPLTVRIPLMEMRTDNANRDITKQVIQSVSGVGGDVMDTGGYLLPYFNDLGILVDVTQWGKEMGFDPTQTYDAIGPDITVATHHPDGSVERRQYAFPCNVYVNMYWVNKATFEKYGIQIPPRRWTVEEFESIGKQFVAAANADGPRERVFFAAGVAREDLYRGMGFSIFNETLTRSTVDDPRFIESLRLLHKWTYEDRLLPSAADRASFDTQAGYGGPTLQLFNRGQFGMFRMGRYALIQLRRFGELDLTVVEPPHSGFPNTLTGTRCAVVYVDGAPELAKYFLAYLASEDYNMQLVRDADALPPNPRYTEVEEFSRPEAYPNEWGLHDIFAESAKEIAIPAEYSPFVLHSIVTRHLTDAEAAVMAEQLSPEAAALRAAERINAEIQRTLTDNPRLRPLYDQLVAQQERIDQRRAQGQPVPLEWIDNPFYRAYYQAMGWAEEAAQQPAAASTAH